MNTPVQNLKSIIKEIRNNNIMLPDFQRNFKWDIDKQKKFIASVISLPSGDLDEKQAKKTLV